MTKRIGFLLLSMNTRGQLYWKDGSHTQVLKILFSAFSGVYLGSVTRFVLSCFNSQVRMADCIYPLGFLESIWFALWLSNVIFYYWWDLSAVLSVSFATKNLLLDQNCWGILLLLREDVIICFILNYYIIAHRFLFIVVIILDNICIKS